MVPLISAVGRLRQVDLHESEAILVCIVAGQTDRATKTLSREEKKTKCSITQIVTYFLDRWVLSHLEYTRG